MMIVESGLLDSKKNEYYVIAGKVTKRILWVGLGYFSPVIY